MPFKIVNGLQFAEIIKKMKRIKFMKMLSLFVFLLAVMFSASAVQLADQGKPMAEIVIDPQADKAARFGAQELRHHLKLVTGGDFKIVTPETRKAENAIFVGDSEPVRKLGIRPSALKTQEYVIAFRDNALILAGKDKKDSQIPLIHYNGTNTAAGKNWPGLFDEQGTMYAVYDFLRDYCNVLWLDSTDAGTVITASPSLKAEGKTEIRKPFMEYRGGTFEFRYDPEQWKRKEKGWLAYRKTAYPAIYGTESDLKKADQRVNQQSRLFLLRSKAGGTYRPANHSFYNYYERFLDKKHKNFETFKPQYFALKDGRTLKENEFIFSAYDSRKEPPQLCYSNPETVAQIVKDIRHYFDTDGYKKKYRNIGALNAGHIWGEDAFCVEAMDNDGFCECPECKKDYEPSRRGDRSEHSTYWFKFVNKVAKEIKKSHPGKKITTLAYGSREGLPTGVRLEDNVIVYFCISANRMPYSTRLAKQLGLLKQWRKAYPRQSMAMWLYNTFPNERTALESGYHCFPGFFGTEVVRQYHLFRDLNIRGGIFHCGFVDDFENFLNLRLMCNPSLELTELKDEYFSSYGKAEKAIRAFYDLVEERYCNPKYYKGNNSHQTKYIAWGLLGTQEVMAKLAQYMKQAEQNADTPQAKARVANWKAGIWEYMRAGKQEVSTLKNEMNGVRVVRTEYNGGHPEPFGHSVLHGKPVKIWAPGCVLQKGVKSFRPDQDFLCFTDGKMEWKGAVNGDAQRMMMYCQTPLKNLHRLRITLHRGKRVFARFTPVILRDGEWRALCGNVIQEAGTHWRSDCQDGMGFVTLELYFEDGIFPEKADGIGILDDSRSENWFFPEYVQIEAE